VADQQVAVAGYDPGWADRFAEQRPLVAELLGPWLAGPVEHIGSTAVPGLRAKPVIDMLAPVSSLVSAQAAVPVLAAAGWLFWPDDPCRGRPCTCRRAGGIPGCAAHRWRAAP
jgi:GrpB-like predicted nucleotidyltransferase (UPF0157 family)